MEQTETLDCVDVSYFAERLGYKAKVLCSRDVHARLSAGAQDLNPEYVGKLYDVLTSLRTRLSAQQGMHTVDAFDAYLHTEAQEPETATFRVRTEVDGPRYTITIY